jgi:hypothetical protein
MLNKNGKKIGTSIPNEIKNIKNLNFTEKFILLKIRFLCKKSGKNEIHTTNEYFSKEFEKSVNQVSKIISKLKKYNFINCKYQKKDFKSIRKITFLGPTINKNDKSIKFFIPRKIENLDLNWNEKFILSYHIILKKIHKDFIYIA